MTDDVNKEAPLDVGGIRVVPLVRRTRFDRTFGPFRFSQWTLEPVGVQIYGDGEPYALDLGGNRSDELLNV